MSQSDHYSVQERPLLESVDCHDRCHDCGQFTEAQDALKLKLPRDMKLGAGTFKAGINLETFLKAVDRHNDFYTKLMRHISKDTIWKVLNEQNSDNSTEGSSGPDETNIQV